MDGGTVVKDTSGLVPLVNTLRLGNSGGSSRWNGYIKKVIFYPRQYPDSNSKKLSIQS